VLGIAVMLWLVLAIVTLAGAYYYVARAGERTDRINARLTRTNAKLSRTNDGLKATNAKLAATLELVTDNQNRSACSIRRALVTARSRTVVGKKAALTPADKAKAQAAIDDYSALIDSQRTTPLDFDCDRVLENPNP
jgi:uncharacterized membrane protein